MPFCPVCARARRSASSFASLPELRKKHTFSGAGSFDRTRGRRSGGIERSGRQARESGRYGLRGRRIGEAAHPGPPQRCRACLAAGIDGAIIVDLPPEEDSELRAAFEHHDLALIRLATPTTDDARLPRVVAGTKGFVYYVSMTGITGAAFSQAASVTEQVAKVRKASGLPVVVGFGVKTPQRAAEVARDADGVVVGSAIVKELHENGTEAALALVKSLADATHGVS